jgi:hypothetical protein
MDEGGGVALPSDETLVDVAEDSPDLTGGESAAEEAADVAGPFADAPDLADLEIED